MTQENRAINQFLLRGACLWIIMALLLAWVIVGLYNQLDFLVQLFPGSPSRVIQAHIDFLLMSALILGFSASGITLPWHVRWAMVVGAFTNSSLFLLYALFPVIDPAHEHYLHSTDWPFQLFTVYLYASLLVTSYGFGRGSVLILLSTIKTNDNENKSCRRCGRELA